MRRLGLIAATLTGLCAAPAAHAEERADNAPYFLMADEGARFPLKESRADFSIAGPIARVRLTQVYTNEGAGPIEAVYVFPASTGAAVHGMRVVIGERTLTAKIAERKAARKTYEAAKDEGKQAGLLEQQRPNVFQMQVANIRPGDVVRVELDYTELLHPTDGEYELVIPSVVGPRFTGESEGDESWTRNPHLPAGQAPTYRWGVSGKVTSGLPVAAIASPSHTVSPRFASKRSVGVEVSDDAGGDRDFVLRYRLGARDVEAGLMLLPATSEDESQYFLLTVAPPARVAPVHRVSREYVFVMDVSGSMSGFPLDTSKIVLRNLLDGLGPQDRFNVVQFAGGSQAFADASVRASADQVDAALSFVDRARGGGGTRLLSALRTAFAMPRDAERSTTFVLVTDGYVSVDDEALALVANRLGEANVFTFGIGRSVNRHLIESLARAGRGAPFVVLSPEGAEKQAARFSRYVEQPVLTDVKVAFEGFEAFDIEPPAFGDVFASRPVTVIGKFRGEPRGRIRVTGLTGAGRFEHVTEVAPRHASDDHTALRPLWARTKVARLGDLDAARGASKFEADITRLGLQYSLLTKFTSFVAVSKSAVVGPDETAETIRQPLPLPQGVSQAALGGIGAVGHGGLSFRGTGSGGGGMAYGRASGSAMGRGVKGKVGKIEMRTVAPRASVRADVGDANVRGSMDKSTIQRSIRRYQGRFRRVYERALKRNASLQGRLTFSLVIGADGRVKSAKIDESTLKDAKFEKDLLRLLKRLRFPKPAGGGTVTVRYPLVFSK